MHLSKKKKVEDSSAKLHPQIIYYYNSLENKIKFNNINSESNNIEKSNDPLYCRCRNISYGNMIECDNSSVISF